MLRAWLTFFILPLLGLGLSLAALAEPAHLTIEGGLNAGTASELRPLAFSPTLNVFLVERNDKRPSGFERSWNFYGRALDLLGYATLATDAGVSVEHAQWMGEGGGAQKAALAELATHARETLVTEPKSLDKLWADWQKLKPLVCPVRAQKRDGGFDLVAKQLMAATIDAPLAPADARRGCVAPLAGVPRCLGASDGDVVVVVPFKGCGVSQEVLVLFNPKNVEYLRESQAGEAALKKNDLASARRHFDASLKLEPKHAPGHFFHALVECRSGMAFRDGRGELEQILTSEEERQLWIPRIKSDPAFASWRNDPEFNRWLGQFPTRVPIP